MDLHQCACSGQYLGKLLRPAVLSLLVERPLHGYLLVQKLGELACFKSQPPDLSGVYKTLKTMAEEGLVQADWEFSDPGPAKKIYALTELGEACLTRWEETLQVYSRQIEALLHQLHTCRTRLRHP